MSEIIRRRLREAIKNKGISATRLSKEAGFSRTYVLDFLNGRMRSMTTANLQKVAEELGVTLGWLTGESSNGAQQASPAPRMHADMPEPSRDLPVFGTAAGSVVGSITLSDNVIDWLVRPAGLRGARDAYALYVVGASMEPRFRAGDLVVVHPHRPLRTGDICVIQTARNGEDQAWVKEFMRFTDKGVLVRQYNEPAEIEFPHETVRSVHRVLTTNELLGT